MNDIETPVPPATTEEPPTQVDIIHAVQMLLHLLRGETED